LKISIAEGANQMITLHLEGKLTGKWVECLANACEDASKNAARVSIDMKNVTFVDREGIILLSNMGGCGIEILNPPAYIADQIRNAAST